MISTGYRILPGADRRCSARFASLMLAAAETEGYASETEGIFGDPAREGSVVKAVETIRELALVLKNPPGRAQSLRLLKQGTA